MHFRSCFKALMKYFVVVNLIGCLSAKEVKKDTCKEVERCIEISADA